MGTMPIGKWKSLSIISQERAAETPIRQVIKIWRALKKQGGVGVFIQQLFPGCTDAAIIGAQVGRGNDPDLRMRQIWIEQLAGPPGH